MGYTLISSSVDTLSDFLSRRKLIQSVFKKNASLRKFKYKFGSLKCFMRSMIKSTEKTLKSTALIIVRSIAK
ncbi:Hypothetical predicted protein [Mytilus galloprovincialis]|uniref:Uncharacterized protein n=1 Tax=Mytilus galloprovincialis TaxID=29158 RepID=A0A8B6D2V4_MYTGA|nr:Hypothetical predicted protein [Mytilus galloprovincialis]